MTDETDAAGEPTTPGDPPHDSTGAAATAGTNAADADATPEVAGPAEASGFGASVAAFARKHRLALSITGGVLALALLGTGAVFAGAAVSGGDDVEAVAATSTPTPTADPARPAPAAAAAASRIRTCSVADRAADGRLANLQAQVVNASTGEVLYDRGGTTPSRTASVMKVLTSAAALSVLGPDYRATTTVVKGTEPGSVVLVGGGDLTLSRTPSGTETVYPGRRAPRRARRPGAGRVGRGPRRTRRSPSSSSTRACSAATSGSRAGTRRSASSATCPTSPPSRSTATGTTPARTRRGAAATRSGAPATRSPPSSAASP